MLLKLTRGGSHSQGQAERAKGQYVRSAFLTSTWAGIKLDLKTPFLDYQLAAVAAGFTAGLIVLGLNITTNRISYPKTAVREA